MVAYVVPVDVHGELYLGLVGLNFLAFFVVGKHIAVVSLTSTHVNVPLETSAGP